YEPLSLPGKASVAPTDIQNSGLMTQIYAPKNQGAAIDAFLRPSISNLETLSPAAHRQSLRSCLTDIQKERQPGLDALADLLREDMENAALLDAFHGLLIGG
ncbi:MAG: hypothetical protein LBJ82_03970, partial [Deltaproteobacteria bacterium]|nr:hypothetical protein [Deltaproteobacteria bacterium]